MARDEYIHRLLLNWARWKAGACDVGLGYGGGIFGVVRTEDRYREAVIPTIALEAEHTDRAVAQLERDLQLTIDALYLRGLGDKAAAERLHVAVATVKERLGRAHRKIAEHLVEIRAQADAKRAALEAAQRVGR